LNPAAIVQQLHQLMAEAQQRGLDTSKAEELDEASKAAADRGEWQENRRLLREALDTVQRALGRQPAAPQPAPKAPLAPRPTGPPAGSM
jgi:hypothetical protein